MHLRTLVKLVIVIDTFLLEVRKLPHVKYENSLQCPIRKYSHKGLKKLLNKLWTCLGNICVCAHVHASVIKDLLRVTL